MRPIMMSPAALAVGIVVLLALGVLLGIWLSGFKFRHWD